LIPRPRLYYPRCNLADHLEVTAARFAEATALKCGGERLSFRELDALSNSLANGLREAGLKAGERVYLALSNILEWPIALFGILRAGGTVVAANPRWNSEEVQHAIELVRPVRIVSDATSRAAVEMSGLPLLTIDPGHSGSFWSLIQESSPEPVPRLERDWETTEAVLFFSSGTTGLPKAVRHSHYSLGASVINWKSALGHSFPDRQQFPLPVFTGFGVSSIIGSVLGGTELHISATSDVRAMLQEIQDERITHSMLVAPVAQKMAQLPDLEEYDLSSLRVLVWCATSVNLPVADLVTQRTGVHWVVGYGMTELLGLTCNPAEYPELCRNDTVGPPRSDGEVRIVDVDTLADLPVGQEGEILARSPARMMGYLPESANEGVILEGGWLRTGDVGKLDEEGWLTITDRIKDLIKVSGLQVAPAEVEGAMLGFDRVKDVAVVGVPDEQRGEVPVAFVVPDGEVSESDILVWLEARLSTYKRPVRVLFVDSIPRTASGKILRRDLRRDAAERLNPASVKS